jgi:hypothetical protein
VGEIKSTMDIIMERTRSLAPSEEEKRAFRRQEIEALARGWVQKAQDQLLSPGKVRESVEEQPPDRREQARKALIRIVIERADPEGDNTVLLELLAEAAGVDPAPVATRLAESRGRLEGGAAARRSELLEALRERGVAGTAVRANLGADPDWSAVVKREREALQRSLEEAALDL